MKGALHPLVLGLIDALPNLETSWPVDGRAKWIRAAAHIFDLVYEGDGTITVEVVQEGSAHNAHPVANV